MSNRLRILFHCAIDGPRAHVGRAALERMRKLSTLPKSADTRVVSKKEWLALGQPPFSDTKILWNTGPLNPDVVYVLENPAAAPVPATEVPLPIASKLDFSVQTAKLLWKRLPAELRKLSQLMVIREDRSNCWRQSLANPRRHGWILQPKPAKTPAAIPASEVHASEVHTLWQQSLLAASEVFESFPATEAPKAPAPKTTSGLNFTTGYNFQKSPNLAKKTKKKSLIPDNDNATSSPFETPSTKPKLRLGIWS